MTAPRNPGRRVALIAATAMASSAALGVALKPTRLLARQRALGMLETLVPRRLGDWQPDPHTVPLQVSPDQLALLQTLYSQTLSRSYVNGDGERMMLSLAYVEQQSDEWGVHLPEVCYPAQGFRMSGAHQATLAVAGRQLPVRRLVARMGARVEPITYWVVVGDSVAATGSQRKLLQMRYALQGLIPDGMLVRISSLAPESDAAYARQAEFAAALHAHVQPAVRELLFGRAEGG